jgi:mono/diheme cytochrome c family protein
MPSLPLKWLVWMLAFALPLSTASAADSARGADLARRWCTSCHVPGTAARAGTDAGPPFAQMAADPAYTDARLRGWLADPHPPMPNLNLSRADIEDVIAHIRGLKPR